MSNAKWIKIKYTNKKGNSESFMAKGITHDTINNRPGVMIWGIEFGHPDVFLQYNHIKNLSVGGI